MNIDWINIKLLNKYRVMKWILSYWMNAEVLNKYWVIEWV